MKTNRNLLIGLSILLRLLSPFLIFKNVLFSIAVNYLLDCCDGLYFYRMGIDKKTYRVIDKILDTYWLTFIFFYLLVEPPQSALFLILAAFFILRVTGVFIFLVRKRESHFIFFPNIFEHLFWIYALCQQFNFQTIIEPPLLYIVILILIPLKVLNEFLVHQKGFCLTNTVTGRKILDWKKKASTGQRTRVLKDLTSELYSILFSPTE